MQQEDYNKMMRYPHESNRQVLAHWEKCPSCNENYCGNGIDRCTDCEIVTAEQVLSERGEQNER